MGDVIDFASYLRFVAALVFVLGLILVAAHITKKVMTGRTYAGARSQGRRLGVVEVLTLDARHRVFLIRRDGKEHLIMTGPSGDLLIEGGIEESQRLVQQTDAQVTPLHAGTETMAGELRAKGQVSAQQTVMQKMAGLFGDRTA
ncbi:flagellar assembly protein FliO [Hwanghaeella grinnelliae]|uniref:Flagellar assembly protein FliO n=1 Tax=Hwanghaeella grinnelliae TaxID=2500179 RepID=A0A3S2VMZ5_9PROT|nr:flagellar biosynthetic protein FliO [Hwanghaeella grinnelliae]RVU34643.1 flagellar assembly protein FliO [Hwanghaeella grinnelliae]